ncbi:MAG: FeS assembly ATPase SufC [Candidatus Woesebacteria bacterium GW2011_GWF2_46_8]|uniref:Cysteine--tRNA ligase n=1 Tax=Candidatus Woesebacteria bacterium GW2011_GWF2_46_8 TaxID=1618604 RepID=A0A0G1QS95_9BACT|nr:MAG: FeS assembly ATPase SufC [Candidatus Woesebacteria bacterium GW2011_GWF2_46_8]
MLEVTNLSVSVGRKLILQNLSYIFEQNKTYVLMGPNGSGKSTFAQTIMGHPQYEIDTYSRIFFNKENITSYPVEKRATSGIFLSLQTPLSLGGITVFQLLRVVLKGKKDALSLKREIMKLAKRLNISQEVLNRSLNQGASGGEKKKMEVLQAGILKPKLAIFDEVDTGVDIDALKTISSYLRHFKKNKTIIFITHNSRILDYIQPDKVLILKNGLIIKDGDADLLSFIEKKGFDPSSLKYLFLTAYYRDTLNFTWESLESAQNALNKLREQTIALKEEKERTQLSPEKWEKVEKYREEFLLAVNDDMNTAKAMAVLWEMLKSNLPSNDKYDLALFFDEVFGLGISGATLEKIEVPKEIEELAKKREELRGAGKFEEADVIRKEIETKGFSLRDTPEGTKITK